MELLSLIKKLKALEPQREYTETSRRLILGTPQKSAEVPLGIGRFFMASFQSVSAIALAGILLLLVFGGFTLGKFFTPFGLSSLDPQNLRAEADEIDIQLQLTKLAQYPPIAQYPPLTQPSSPTHETTTIRIATPVVTPKLEEKAEQLGVETTTSTDETSINQALEILSQ